MLKCSIFLSKIVVTLWELCIDKDDLENVTLRSLLTPMSSLSTTSIPPIFPGPHTQTLPNALSCFRLINEKWVSITPPGPRNLDVKCENMIVEGGEVV